MFTRRFELMAAAVLASLVATNAKADFTPVVVGFSTQLTSPTKMLNGVTNEWGYSSDKFDPAPWVAFDLTSVGGSGAGDNSTINLGLVTFWANNDGGYGLAGAIDLYYSADLTAAYDNNTTNLTFLGNYPVSIVNANPTAIDFGGVQAQYVKFLVTAAGGNQGTLGNMNFEGPGFAEVQFAAAAGVPEPASLGLLAAGGLMLLARRRR